MFRRRNTCREGERARIGHERNDEGLVFCCTHRGQRLGPGTWATHPLDTADGHHASVAPLLALLEEERCTEREDGVLLPHAEAAKLTKGQVAALGLPPVAPHELDITCQGAITDPDFTFSYRWIRNGMPVLGRVRREGCQVNVGGERFSLLDPLYTLADRMDRFNTLPPEGKDDRFLLWADMKALLPEDGVKDQYLSEMRIARADAFTLDNSLAPDGSFTFSPVPVRVTEGDWEEVPGTSEEERQSSLPPAKQERFSGEFVRFSGARSNYALGDAYYLVVPEKVRRALQVAREVLGASATERRAFFLKPREVLKARLGEELDEETIEALFYESAEYSERVRGVIRWEKPVIPFYQPASEPWLPPEKLALDIGGQRVEVTLQELPDLAAKVSEAVQEGRPSITYKGVEIPATQETLEAVNVLVEAAGAGEREGKPRPSTEEKPTEDEKPPLTVDVQRNIDEDEAYRAKLEEEWSRPFPEVPLRSSPLAHQAEGIAWLEARFRQGQAGALLADDMGLGKTFQVLAFLRRMQTFMEDFGKGKRQPILIVGPTALLENWRQEHDRHLGEVGLGEVTVAHGAGLRALFENSAVRTNELQTGAARIPQSRLTEKPWVLTTYETLRDYQHSFCMVPWTCVVFDEVQRIKNPAALMTDAAKGLNSRFTIGLTGTPVENKLEDLWCIADALQAGFLGTLKEFSGTYGTADQDGLLDLKKKLEQPAPPFMIRRMKQDRLEGLPERQERVIDRPMPKAQADAYAAAVQATRAAGAGQGHMLKAIQGFRSISLHPKFRSTETDEAYIDGSARLTITFELLDQIHGRGEKCLVFLESLEMHGILCELIQRRYKLPDRPMVISGKVAGPKRQQRVNRFQEDRRFDVMILSPRAGGLGLTLTAANNVIHLSRWWNPAIEDQCTDRVYRIGQKRPVNVYIPRAIHPEYGDHSFDIRLHALLEGKRNLSRTLLAPPSVTDADVQDLYRDTTEW